MAASPSAVMARFETVVLGMLDPATSRPRFRLSPSRFEFDKEPEGGMDRSFRVELGAESPLRPYHGIAQAFRQLSDLAVQVAYFRGGGTLGGTAGGDRKSINRRTLDDMVDISVACESDATYDSENTGIRVVRFTSFARVADLERVEMWACRFDVEWESAIEVAA